MPNLTIDDIPIEILQNILRFADDCDLVNASYVSRDWNQKLKGVFNKFKEVYQSLLEENAEVIVEECIKSPQVTRVTCMARELLKKLTLDQVTVIATSSYVHAEVVFKSRLFHDKPISKKPEAKSLEDFFFEISTLDLDFKSDVFQILMSCHFFSDLSVQINKLSRSELVEEEINMLDSEFQQYNGSVSSNISAKTICRAYIARAVAEKSVQHFRLALLNARETLGKPRLISLCRLSLEHTKAILSSNLLKKTLESKFLLELTEISEAHKKLMYSYSINTVSILPLRIATSHPSLTKSIALLIVKDIFFDPVHNINWRKFQEKQPELAWHILEIKKVLNKKLFQELLLKKLMHVSVVHVKEILSIPSLEKLLNDKILEEIALKDTQHFTLVNEFLSKREGDALAITNSGQIDRKTHRP